MSKSKMAAPMQIPRRLPLLVESENVLLPGSSMRIAVRSLRNINMVKSRLMGRNTLSSTIIGVVPKDPDSTGENMTLHSIGTAAVVVQVTAVGQVGGRGGGGGGQAAYTLLVTGLCRFRLEELLQETPFPVATVHQLDKLPGENAGDDALVAADVVALAEDLRSYAGELVELLDVSIPAVARLKQLLDKLPSHQLPDVCAAVVKASFSERLQVLDAVELEERIRATLPLLMRQIEGLKLLQSTKKSPVTSLVHKRGPARKDKAIVMRRIPNGEEDDDDGDDLREFEAKIKEVGMPTEAEKAAMKELKRLRKMPQQMPEHALIRNYLELMVELPWSKSTVDVLDIGKARADLDVDHYGLEKLKKRVIEYLAVRQLRNSLKGPILCFVGPPGVGKTSIGRSIANTLGRQFHRISLGGVCDQSDIRGHRRTYVGSMPGRIIHGLKLTAARNPVFLLDEIDKLGKSLHGDPASALLEVLDPEQNNSFVDHYLNTPFDLSQVLFIATANSLQGIPTPLLDRMEIIHVPGYTQEERVNIGLRHLVPKQLKEHGLSAEHVQIPEETLKLVVSSYTREAGVRMLERRIAAIFRAVAVKVAEHSKRTKDQALDSLKVQEAINNEGSGESEGKAEEETVTASLAPQMPIVIDREMVEDILGPPMFESETAERLSLPGVAVGLAWTTMGGEIMYVEATKMQGKGKVTLTGQLGDVMKESANLALNWLRTHQQELCLEEELLGDTDLHVHFPAGAVSKDGPSAGVTVVTVLASLFSGRCVRSDTAMTGEITLRGLVLPVGGIKEKMLAAHRAGLTHIILPRRNEKDLHEVPANVKDKMRITFVRRVEDVLNAAFDGGFPGLSTLSPPVPAPVLSKL